MARTKPANQRLNDSINVPMNRLLKRRIIALSKLHPAEPSYTRYARMLLEKAVADLEAVAERDAAPAAVAAEPELAAASA